jgi:hypothetical protein
MDVNLRVIHVVLSTYRVSCKTTSVHGSIPHQEREFNMLLLQKSVRPEVSKGEKDFCKRLHRIGKAPERHSRMLLAGIQFFHGFLAPRFRGG